MIQCRYDKNVLLLRTTVYGKNNKARTAMRYDWSVCPER